MKALMVLFCALVFAACSASQTAEPETNPLSEESATPGEASIPPRDVVRPTARELGSYSNGEIPAVIKANAQALRVCYEPRLAEVPTLAGKTVIRFIIGVDGTVTDAKVETAFDEAVDTCVVEVIKSMVFPLPTGVIKLTVVEYPFRFQPE
ncbi:MAG: hypothetical protein AUK47_02095 [Deltaproteobacteria bacterium CG2_30_63_29]|nr:MAG: hypothetical protein AUK47_02095 [Deltaproteobacteria bacterium CG2_30_63_29]PIW01048.1 MAG: hypothetical protein COW42_06090 [Deltaproteobacteria bacterium CG17_big_fil_post_rev_8_21_14_2_50_63_7]PJB47152.1 MAG: hypothetical protein CO108_04610 [Deltaproteobacteria bacterium CG_4_9_14_3_um_filter_63_12]